jgi:hypothetical protein
VATDGGEEGGEGVEVAAALDIEEIASLSPDKDFWTPFEFLVTGEMGDDEPDGVLL